MRQARFRNRYHLGFLRHRYHLINWKPYWIGPGKWTKPTGRWSLKTVDVLQLSITHSEIFKQVLRGTGCVVPVAVEKKRGAQDRPRPLTSVFAVRDGFDPFRSLFLRVSYRTRARSRHKLYRNVPREHGHRRRCTVNVSRPMTVRYFTFLLWFLWIFDENNKKNIMKIDELIRCGRECST